MKKKKPADIVEKLTTQLEDRLREAYDEEGLDYGKAADDEAHIVQLAIARQLAALTAEVREMVKMQREAMDMAKAMLEKFADKLP